MIFIRDNQNGVAAGGVAMAAGISFVDESGGDAGSRGAGANAALQHVELVRRGRLYVPRAGAGADDMFEAGPHAEMAESVQAGSGRDWGEGCHGVAGLGSCIHDIASCVQVGRRGRERKRVVGLEDFARAVKELQRALAVERIDSLSAHLVCVDNMHIPSKYGCFVECCCGEWSAVTISNGCQPPGMRALPCGTMGAGGAGAARPGGYDTYH